MKEKGYYRYPTIFQDQIVFVADDDLWQVSLTGGMANRLTTSRGLATTPVFSPDGRKLAFASSDEGALEVCLFDFQGGELQRLSYLGATAMVCAWTEKGIYFSAPAGQFLGVSTLWHVDAQGGVATPLNKGPCQNIDFNRQGAGSVIQRQGYREFGYWKRYRGGTAGEIWIDLKGDGHFNRLLDLKSNLAKPLWLQGRIYFSSDHEGIGNLYSCTPQGTDLRRHTHHHDYYVRNQSTDGNKIVYHAGADLYVYDPLTDRSNLVPIRFTSPAMQRQRKWVQGSDNLYHYSLHPKGQHIASTHRGKLLTYNAFEGPVLALSAEDGSRYRLCAWLKDGKRLIASHDHQHQDILEIFDAETGQSLKKSPLLDLGRLTQLKVNPQTDHVAMINHRAEVMVVCLDTWRIHKIDRSAHGDIMGMDWSPDGLWLAYDCTLDRRLTAIKMFGLKSREIHQITAPVLKDHSPTFDPEGKYLYFLSLREFTPTYDTLHFDLGFLAGMRPHLITLREDVPHPFIQGYQINSETADDTDDESKEASKESSPKEEEVEPLVIDFDGIQERLIALPIEPGHFSHPTALKGKLVYLSHPLVEADPEEDEHDESPVALEVFDLDTKKTDEFLQHVDSYDVSLDRKYMIYEAHKRLRLMKVLEKPEENSDGAGRKSGWANLKRLNFMVDPLREWQQIFDEAWRLQKDHFWVEDMADIDWKLVYNRYLPLLSRVCTRRELTDLLWEMHGELGTSHAYVVGGDLKIPPQWSVGFLGARFVYDDRHQCYRVHHLMKGDLWSRQNGSPLAAVGARLKVGDRILAVNGFPLKKGEVIESRLIAKVKQEVLLTVQSDKEKKPRTITVRTVSSQQPMEYRDWVNANRCYVHEKSKGQVGYLHIPDMATDGYSEFHRGFLAECDRPGLVVDGRFNGGGHVSQLLLEKLARRRLGYDMSRWMGAVPYPSDSTHGRLVALVNEFTGSDGDMFASMFKAMKLGPLIGKRTWGGVIGTWVKHSLVDRGYTTQPEYSFWSFQEGWGMENHGVDPDIEVEIMPYDYQVGRDTQLERGVEEVLKILEQYPIAEPDFSKRPTRKLPSRLETLKELK